MAVDATGGGLPACWNIFRIASDLDAHAFSAHGGGVAILRCRRAVEKASGSVRSSRSALVAAVPPSVSFSEKRVVMSRAAHAGARPPRREHLAPAARVRASLTANDSMESAEELASITGLALEQAAVLLEASGGDLATAVQLHFDNEERGASAADEAAARAVQQEEDAAYEAALAANDADANEYEFPGVPPDIGGVAPRAARSPVMGAPPGAGVGDPAPPSRLARLYVLLGRLVSIPGISFLYQLLLGGGRFFYSTGTRTQSNCPAPQSNCRA